MYKRQGENILAGILVEMGDIRRFDDVKEIQKLSGDVYKRQDIRMQQVPSIQEQRLKLLIRNLEQLFIQSRVWMESYHQQQTTMFIHGNLIDLVLLLRSQIMPVMSALSVIMMMVPDVIS